MPAFDKNRIEGFGNDSSPHVWSCPAGHMLLRGSLQAETVQCDRCYQPIVEGETVMDCRRCDWRICRECHPPTWKEDDDSIWGTFSLIVDTATREVAKGVTEVEAFVSELRGHFEGARSTITCQPASKSQMVEEGEIVPLAEHRAFGDGQYRHSSYTEEEQEGSPSPRRWSTVYAGRSDEPLLGAFRAEAAEEKKAVLHAGARQEPAWDNEERTPQPVGACQEPACDNNVRSLLPVAARQEPLCNKEEHPPQPVLKREALEREYTDLIELGETEVLEAVPSPPPRAPVGSRAPREPLDLLDLPGSMPKEETLLDFTPSEVWQPPMMFAQLGA